jgi:hypothetical protein
MFQKSDTTIDAEDEGGSSYTQVTRRRASESSSVCSSTVRISGLGHMNRFVVKGS